MSLHKGYIRSAAALAVAIVLLLPGCAGKGSPAPEGGGAEHPSAAASANAETEGPGESAGTADAAGTKASSAASAGATGTPAASARPTKGTFVDGWITGIPENVPKFGYGTLDSTGSKIVEGSISSTFHLCFRGVQRTNIDEYAGFLKDKGYVVAVAEIGSTYTLTASLGRTILVITLSEQEGVATFALGAPV